MSKTKAENNNPIFSFESIGIISTPYKEKYEAPRQPGAQNEQIEGIISLFPHKNYEQALDDLDGFEKIWVISWFDRNTDWKPKVLPPRSGRTKRGVFSTRSPHRPNPIGISVCSLIEISGLNIRVLNPDLLDKTPILDIKPYIPYADSYPDSRAGWIDDLRTHPQSYNFTISQLAKEQFHWLSKKHSLDFTEHIKKTLTLDPFPHPFRRIKQVDNNIYVIGYKAWRVIYSIHNNEIEILRIESGYTETSLSQLPTNKNDVADTEIHREFIKTWFMK